MKSDTLRPELKRKIHEWMVSLHRLDPRYKILTFFNTVASEGADHMCSDSESFFNTPERESLTPLEQKISEAFNRTSILSVWRPTSNDAMRNMMQGTGVGKGLDIKGKSARQGNLSARVPFLQIHDNLDKKLIQPIASEAVMRVYFTSIEARDGVLERLETVALSSPSLHKNNKASSDERTRNNKEAALRDEFKLAKLFYFEPKSVPGQEAAKQSMPKIKKKLAPDGDGFVGQTNNNNRTGKTRQSTIKNGADRQLEYNMEDLSETDTSIDPVALEMSHESSSGIKEMKDDESLVSLEMTPLDGYAPNHYGIQVSQRLFWQVFVAMQDISRSAEQDTGRPSTPGFQDANLYSLADGLEQQSNPLPVVLQLDEENPFCPQNLVMAYEEHKKVVPVVSDFDGFLLGWRREALWFGCSLPPEQEELMIWSVDNIERILDAPPSLSTWTEQWLDILKKQKSDGFSVAMPPYGFGDPKSYAIMETAAKRLSYTGAIRHGSECFNYYFPQEIDDLFLVISDTLSPVRWKNVGIDELQQILSDRIDDGFMFPLNPKWILCDPGWKHLYDKLMNSNALYADLSKDVWFPPRSGVRKRIEEIHKRHPYGFKRIGEDFAHSLMQSVTSRESSTPQVSQKGSLSGQAEAELAEVELEILEKSERSLKRPLSKSLDRSLKRSHGSRSLTEGSNLFEQPNGASPSPRKGSTPSPSRRKGVFGLGRLGNSRNVPKPPL